LQSQQSISPVAGQEAPAPPSSRTPALLTGLGIATSIVLIAVLIVVLSRGGAQGGSVGEAGVLLIRWETDQRQGAVLEVDGENVSLPAEREVKVTLKRRPRFRHRIVMRRSGYESIERDLTVTPDERLIVQPNWQRKRR
jgi:hypothetical protein